MHPITTKISTEIDVLYGLCKLAEDYSGEEAGKKKVKKDELVDSVLMSRRKTIRKRILQRIDSVSKSAKRLFKLFEEADNIPMNDKLLIHEKQEMMDEVLDRFENDNNALIKQLYKKVVKIRNRHAISKNPKSDNPHRYTS